MARITLSCLPASWYCSVSLLSLGCAPRQRLLLLLLLFIISTLLIFGTNQRLLRGPQRAPGAHYNKYLSIAESMEATDILNPALNYGIVVDCGSSGSRVFVYYWRPHNGNPHTLLDIRQMKDHDHKPVVKKIKPGISTLSKAPTQASNYLQPLLSFAAAHVPKSKHKETPLYILCTAGMRLLPESQQTAILEDLVSDVPLEFDFLFSSSHAEVISGKQEGVYAWIGINFVLGRFDHADNEDATVEVTTGSQNQQPISRRRTVGIMDMGGASLQIAYEVPSAITFNSPQEEEAGKSVLAEFNLGCDVEHTQHVYRVYVTTFLGFGGNMARQRYEDQLLNKTFAKNRFLTAQTGLTEDKPYLDPCLPAGLSDTVVRDNRTLYLRGQGAWADCQHSVQPFLGLHNGTMSPGGVYQAPINFSNSEFYGFSEFYYCMEDVLRMGGQYDSGKYSRAATDYCSTRWSTLKQRLDNQLFAQQADISRLKHQCFKSAWMYEVLHSGFRFPADYPSLKTAQLVYDKEVQWTLGAILYKTRFLPLRDLQQETLRQSHPSWLRSSFVYNHHLFSLCILVVVLAILLYILRLRRIHQREQRQAEALSLLWVEEGDALLP
ncbi:ectonucleoside triphosphate diphosphohydrolase 7-like [Hippoglossus hippoglossus]|uniref:ectonucleoside triphosphate diphosphohydrolase 7-like n=1 Tax=Hippoglossus hippoglossus TaxID=8267 RepID=UPI00148D2EC9|nr:ectonucleoside triphosphate diphosphohydrolase 7-like [Hippoglossus hippoglossus]XP_034998390.1 ectonucleoside triphosphate diphosphohydrolase 7 [Hippoglossus stenolepis]XP_034998401.1 ectonucleoside triphosphate diphosphohydrolase 7 [Hippoglossus stenolepis]